MEFKDITAAAERISAHVHLTPLLSSSSISEMIGCNKVFVKAEALQRTGSFKIRGATNAIAVNKPTHVITHSSGNHGQAVALAAKQMGIKATIVMPESAPQVKKDAVKGYGATIVECESTNAARQTTVDRLCTQDNSLCFIHPSNDLNVMAGQGTVGLEILSQVQDLHETLDAIFVPIGGGGLCSGVIRAVRHLNPNIAIYGVEPEGAADAFRSVKSGTLQGHRSITPNTIADGLRTTLGNNNWPIIRDGLTNDDDDGVILVTDDEIIAAMKLIWQRMKILVEPSGAVAMAGAIKKKDLISGRNVAIVASGGNVDLKIALELLLKTKCSK